MVRRYRRCSRIRATSEEEEAAAAAAAEEEEEEKRVKSKIFRGAPNSLSPRLEI